MSSIVSGFEYDVFISYRHNDNRSGWVTEFVRALQEELASAIKEPVSVYFDTNPHDGLLETHNVDKSLSGKLKCLIFIPIISQTYCDPKSFAWQHEFVAFNKMALEDQVGKDIRLGNGNVASRILPIKIHDIDFQDELMLEKELGSVLRAIEFIFNSPGVNRPLIPLDNPDKNQNQTFYRDQINKAANAVKEIIRGIRNREISADVITPNDSPLAQNIKLPFGIKLKRRNVLRASLVYILTALVIWKIIVISSGMLNLTTNFIQGLTLILIVLFPFAMLLAWLYERGPQGFIRTGSAASLENPFKDEQKKPFTSITFIALLLVTTVALFVLFPQVGRAKSVNGIAHVEKSIAVMPFVNDSPDEANSYFINGIMEEVLNNLQKIKDFRVLSRTSVEKYRGSVKMTIPQIAKQLDVNYIVEGSGQKYGDKFVLRVQLIAADNERHLWAKSYNREIHETSDIINIQSEIAQLIGSELEVIITPEVKQFIEKPPTTNLTAYDFYQRGREVLVKYDTEGNTKEMLNQAEILFHRALKYDSTFAQAYTALAGIYWDRHYYDEYFAKNFLDSVLTLADIALSHDDRLSEAYVIRGQYYAAKGLPNRAMEEYDNAIKFNPNEWMAYFGKSGLYGDEDLVNSIGSLQKAASLNHGSELPYILGRLGYVYHLAGFSDKARYFYLEKLKLDGDSGNYFSNLGVFEIDAGNFEKGKELLIKGFERDSANIFILNSLGSAYVNLGQFREAYKYYFKYATRLETLGQFTLNNMHRIGFVYIKNGYTKQGISYFDKQITYCQNLIKSGRQSPYTNYDLAGVYAFIGDKSKAYENLRIFNNAQKIPLWMASLIKSDPLFDSIRNEPEFQKIEKDVEAKYQAEHERVRKWLEEKGML